MKLSLSLILAMLLLIAAQCSPMVNTTANNQPKLLAVETFLADIAQNVAGDRAQVAMLMPIGVDPHGFEPTPQDVAKVAQCEVLIVNGAGVETFLEELLQNAGGSHKVIEAAAGLSSREIREGKVVEELAHAHEGDPHFWLDPTKVVKYVENIRDGLSQADPDGATKYAANAVAYIAKLKALDQWITEQVKQLPESRRLMVTNHESFGYFADRYGFKIIGTIVPNVSPGASPSAQQLAQLIDLIKQTGSPAIFLETGSNPQLAKQVAEETGLKVVKELYSHSITDGSGPAPTYLEMMKYNTQTIVNALKIS